MFLPWSNYRFIAICLALFAAGAANLACADAKSDAEDILSQAGVSRDWSFTWTRVTAN